MRLMGRILVVLVALGVLGGSEAAAYESRDIQGWTMRVRPELLGPERRAASEAAIRLIEAQLTEVARLVPSAPLAELRKVRIYLSPPYPGFGPKAEYHPSAGWLRANGRDPAMAKAVEFTNLDQLEREVRRMPMLALHELAHAYHDQVLGFDNPQVRAAYERARAAGTYASVSRRDWRGRQTDGVPAYALTNDREYFAETTEAFFGRNDFFPYDRAELLKADPGAVEMLRAAWQAP